MNKTTALQTPTAMDYPIVMFPSKAKDNEMVELNRDALKKEIMAQDLKRWWVAEFSGVHITTLRRWLSGRIQKVRRHRVSRLAGVLCIPERTLCNALGDA